MDIGPNAQPLDDMTAALSYIETAIIDVTEAMAKLNSAEMPWYIAKRTLSDLEGCRNRLQKWQELRAERSGG